MSANVIPLASRRSQSEPACRCPQHQMWDLADRVREALAQSDGELLVTRHAHVAVLEDVLSTIDVVMGESSGPRNVRRFGARTRVGDPNNPNSSAVES